MAGEEPTEEMEALFVDVNGVADDIGPEGIWDMSLFLEGDGQGVDHSDDAFGDRVEVMIVWRAHVRVQEHVGFELLECL